ncbi:hypothetical protein VPH35_110135 [Triticum aestivum]
MLCPVRACSVRPDWGSKPDLACNRLRLYLVQYERRRGVSDGGPAADPHARRPSPARARWERTAAACPRGVLLLRPREVTTASTPTMLDFSLQGHKRTTCPDRGDVPKPVRRPARCKNCGVEGHIGITSATRLGSYA